MENEVTIGNNNDLMLLLFSILVKRLGGELRITQDDIDDIAFSTLEEGDYEDGSLGFRLIEPRHYTS